MGIFPHRYSKPVLTGIVQAAAKGWNAKCASGATPSSGWNDCANGPNVGQTPVCPGHGFGATGNRLYEGGGSSRLLDPSDVSRGL